MSLPLALLGLLNYQDSTGYDLTRMFEDSLNNFWHAQSSQIYRELNRMEKLEWVTSRSIAQEGRPNKRLYTITETGRNKLARWLANANLEFENPHHVILMRVFFGANAPQATLALLKRCQKYCQDALAENCSAIRHNIETYAAQLKNGQENSRYWAMTLEFGIAQTKATLEWAERCIAQIEQIKEEVPE